MVAQVALIRGALLSKQLPCTLDHARVICKGFAAMHPAALLQRLDYVLDSDLAVSVPPLPLEHRVAAASTGPRPSDAAEVLVENEPPLHDACLPSADATNRAVTRSPRALASNTNFGGNTPSARRKS